MRGERECCGISLGCPTYVQGVSALREDLSPAERCALARRTIACEDAGLFTPFPCELRCYCARRGWNLACLHGALKGSRISEEYIRKLWSGRARYRSPEMLGELIEALRHPQVDPDVKGDADLAQPLLDWEADRLWQAYRLEVTPARGEEREQGARLSQKPRRSGGGASGASGATGAPPSEAPANIEVTGAPKKDLLGRKDSNLRLAVPETAALPLGHSPMRRRQS